MVKECFFVCFLSKLFKFSRHELGNRTQLDKNRARFMLQMNVKKAEWAINKAI